MRVVTPGTVTDEALLDENEDALLVAITKHHDDYAFAALDLAASRFFYSEAINREQLLAEMERLKPFSIAGLNSCAPT